jgi:regulatory protein
MASKTLTPQQAREKIRRYCAYQERAHQEVRDKLYAFGLYRDDVDEILSELISENFLNEERFARAYAGGKFRMKKWGRIKITEGLSARGVSSNCIRLALTEIDDADYRDTLQKLLEEKQSTLQVNDRFVLRDRLSRYVIQKGYEPDLVWSVLREMLP